MAGFKARFAKSLDDIVAVLNLNMRDLEKSSLGGTKTIIKSSSDSAPESILIPNPVASVENTEHDLLQGLNKGGYLHLIPALHAYVESLQSREDVADGFAMLNASRLVPVERLPIGDILAPHLSAVNPHVQYILGSQKGVAGGVCDLDSMGVIPIERIPVGLLGGLTPKFLWNPATNTPYLANPAPATTRGWFYISSGEGTQLGTDWANGDWCISDGASWLKLDNTDRVSSVFGRLGAITAQAGDYAAHYAPLNTTMANNAGSATPPATASGSLVSKLQALRDNVVYILAHLLTLGETSETAYRGDRGKTAYDHSQSAHAPANADNTQAALNAGASKAAPVDADTLALLDSASSNSIKKLTWANLIASSRDHWLNSNRGDYGGVELSENSYRNNYKGLSVAGTFPGNYRLTFMARDEDGASLGGVFCDTANKWVLLASGGELTTDFTPPTSADGYQIPTTAWVKAVAAPISHASTATTYGRSDATNFGHAMASSAAPAMNDTASAGTDNGKFAREGHVHPSDTSRATRAKDSVVALSSDVTMSSVVDGTTYTLPQYGTVGLPANVGSIGDRVFFTVTGCSAGPITVNGLQKSGGQGVSGIIAEKCALGWCVC